MGLMEPNCDPQSWLGRKLVSPRTAQDVSRGQVMGTDRKKASPRDGLGQAPPHGHPVSNLKS